MGGGGVVIWMIFPLGFIYLLRVLSSHPKSTCSTNGDKSPSFTGATAQALAKRLFERSDKKKKNAPPKQTFSTVEFRVSILFQFLKK